MPDELPAGWSDRVAPGPLELVQDFLNTPDTEPTVEELRVAATIRSEAEAGEQQASIAARHGVSQQLVSAVLRGKRSATIDGEGISAAPTFGTASSSRAWLKSRGFDVGALSLAGHDRLRRLRESLIALCFVNNGQGDDEGALRELSALAELVPLNVSLDVGPRLVPGAGANVFEASILGAVYDAMRDGTWIRLKACPADRCRHVFYDSSRNRTSSWCSMAVICGNRTKVRNYQQRLRDGRRP